MPILNIQSSQAGLTGVLPAIAYINTNDTEAQVLATGYLNQAVQSGLASFSSPCMCCVSTVNSAGAQPSVGWYELSYSAGNWSLVSTENAAPAVFPVTTSSATPGTIRAITGKVTETATTVTSGNLVGVRGEVDFVGSSTSAFIYGVQGKLIASGTLASGQFQAGVFGQLDIHAATINGGQLAPIWGDWGTSSGTLSSQTGLYGLAMTNTTAAVLEGQIYLYGGATNLLYLNTNAGLSGTTYFKAAGTGASSWGYASYAAATEVLQISVNGTTYYVPCKASNA
jgi:hypothetical protein